MTFPSADPDAPHPPAAEGADDALYAEWRAAVIEHERMIVAVDIYTPADVYAAYLAARTREMEAAKALRAAVAPLGLALIGARPAPPSTAAERAMPPLPLNEAFRARSRGKLQTWTPYGAWLDGFEWAVESHAANSHGRTRWTQDTPSTDAERAERFEREARTFEAQAIENWNLAKAADARAELSDYFRHSYEKVLEQVRHLEAERIPPTAAERAAHAVLLNFWNAYRAVEEHRIACVRCIDQLDTSAPECAEWRALAMARTGAEGDATEALYDAWRARRP